MLALLTMCFAFVQAQQKHDWEDYFYDIYGLDDYDETQMAEDYDRLCELETSPLNINDATLDQMMDIPGLTLDQAEQIFIYRDRYGGFLSIEELSMLPSIDARQRVFLSHFFQARPVEKGKWYAKENLTRILRAGHGEVLATAGIPFYSRKGDREGYLGEKYKYGVKLTGKFSDHIKYGLIGAQDAGEPLFKGGNKYGMDYYSFFVNVNGLGRIKSLLLGRYRVKMGLGLVQNGNFSFGKQIMLASMSRPTTRIAGHSTRSDANYLQGIASTIDIGKEGSKHKWELSAFYSYRYIDATLNDSGQVKTIVKSGYHRTVSEMQKKYNTAEANTGAHISYDYGSWHAGMTGTYDWFNRDLSPMTTTPFRRYSPRGNAFWNLSVDYGYISSAFTLSGETATGDCGAIATLNVIQAKVSNDLTLTGVQRFYSYRYYALHANAFSDGGAVQNESGMYLGAQWRAGRHLVIDAYSDLAYHPWARYQASASSYSWDNSLSGTYTMKQWTLLARYRLRLKQRDNEAGTALYDRYEHRFRLALDRSDDVKTIRTQLDLSNTALENHSSFGWMLSQTGTINLANSSQFSAMLAYFHTKDYDSRLYAREKSLPGSFSMPSFFGEGMRFSVLCKARLSDRLQLSGKLGFTKYFDRDVISSALRQIDSSCQTDLDVSAKWKF